MAAVVDCFSTVSACPVCAAAITHTLLLQTLHYMQLLLLLFCAEGSRRTVTIPPRVRGGRSVFLLYLPGTRTLLCASRHGARPRGRFSAIIVLPLLLLLLLLLLFVGSIVSRVGLGCNGGAHGTAAAALNRSFSPLLLYRVV